ncbi:hypothetical protein Y032_0009g475 [Ancylostoma ceylanicum]|uniref:Uncharacterized protein n=1 Tax=Ancylostoma ceylanicum TaxID=53326 RepID=A0A016VHD4_9BILA|nr:hypothetical protein Y032_0009g475 [Ancylostoma ceylanicum]
MTTNLYDPSTIRVGNDLRGTDCFKYLGMTGVLCDKNIPDRFKSKVYPAVVRSVALYGAEQWPATKKVER